MATVTGTLKFYHTENLNRRLLTNQRVNYSSVNLQDYQTSILDNNPMDIPVLAGNTMLLVNATQKVELTIENASGSITLITDCLLFPDTVSKITVKKNLLNSNVHIIQC